jgi:glucose/arabinose dehydrogenase
MKKPVFILLMTGISILVIVAAAFSFRNFRGIGPAIKPPPEDIADRIPAVPDTTPAVPGQNETGMPLRLPPGFSISIFARDIPGARVMVQDSFGNFWVSRTRQGIVSVLDVREGRVVRRSDVFRGLNNPHGLAMGPHDLLYIAEEDKVSRVTLYSDDTLTKLVDLPSGGGHSTRTIMFGPDGRLYISIGSSCNACEERDERRAAIYVMEPDGSNFRRFASGLRNAVFMTTNPVTGDIWATEMGRDFLGDDVPPDEINIIREGRHYGWPWCYGNRVHDAAFDARGERRDFCRETEPPVIEIPAHSAPLGLAFVPEEGWPEEYWYNLLVAYHGSWNRSTPTGYKVVRHILDARGNYRGSEDFITGWLRNGSALGRPADIMVQPGGIMYISDDKAGVIYRVIYRNQTESVLPEHARELRTAVRF